MTLSLHGSARYHFLAILAVSLAMTLAWAVANGENHIVVGAEPLVTFQLPKEGPTRESVHRAAEWLIRHLRSGELTINQQPRAVSVIAWKDPTLHQKDPELLAGYLITDTLWASRALAVVDPAASDILTKRLKAIGGDGNGAHEVLWTRLDTLCHRNVNVDPIHGDSLGIMKAGDGQRVDVRQFKMAYDLDYSKGHPRLFAEHAIYEALCDHWNGRGDVAKHRVCDFFRSIESITKDDPIRWDQQRGILIDLPTLNEWKNLSSSPTTAKACTNSTFKIGLLLYAIKVMGLEQEFPAELTTIRRRLWNSQHEDGGLAHFCFVTEAGKTVRAPGATGEATSIAILAETVGAKK